VRIAIDAMGGDHAPAEIVRGALAAAPEVPGSLILVGIPEQIQKHIPGKCPANVDIHPAAEVVGMEEKPTDVLRKKKNSSIAVCVELVRLGQAEAVVSAGNTGAATATSLMGWRQISGIHRPAIAAEFPSKHGRFLLLDAGASPDVDPAHLLDFALMGRAYAKGVMGKSDPKVHLLNIGEEPGKGNTFAKTAFDHLARHPWFAGNIEGNYVFKQDCDVVVCDAYTGNIFLKATEGVAEFMMSEIREAIPKGPSKILFLPLKSVFGPLRKKVDYAEYGGMPLLGLNGITIICHGRSSAKAILNAIRQARSTVESGVVEQIRQSVL
jgi:phosphate acyltransferase